MTEPRRPDRPPVPPTLSGERLDALWAAVDAQTSREGRVAALRSWPTPLRVAVVLAAQGAVAAVSLGLQGPRGDLAGIALPLAAVALVAFALSSISLRSAAAPPLRGARWLGWAVAVPFLAVAPPVWPGIDMGALEAMPIHVLCLLWSVGTSAVAVVPAVLFDRHGLLRRWSTLAMAGAAGLLGLAVQMAHCPLASPEHLLATHATGGVLVGALLTAVARRSGR